ncbi:hypothetical protein HMPREF9418_0780 [Neisseria macacae ATCC 33926]|uniref:Uncharacterized protein n=1 Tax=Neisseria macacae ATCC 33926 TaxID=997348 RepID=A0AA36UKF8_9NEIS|nr:hypothetical protein HMPREF9418_0780 [Neisseria macacae ATCC 33926]
MNAFFQNQSDFGMNAALFKGCFYTLMPVFDKQRHSSFEQQA